MEQTATVRQNYSVEVENGINNQINMELTASYVYLSMASYFSRHDVALPNIAKFFKEQSHEEREHAEKLIDYQSMRGGSLQFSDIKAPEIQDWKSALYAFESALILEKKVNESLLTLHAISSRNNDPQCCDFLETHYLEEQVKSIKELADHVTNLKRVGGDMGVYIFEKEFNS